MTQITVEDVYRGERYNVMGEVMKDLSAHGIMNGYDERTWLETLLVKHSLIAAERIIKEGGFVSEITGTEPLSFDYLYAAKEGKGEKQNGNP